MELKAKTKGKLVAMPSQQSLSSVLEIYQGSLIEAKTYWNLDSLESTGVVLYKVHHSMHIIYHTREI